MSLPSGCEATCRGCFHRDISLEASLKQKTDWLKKVLSPWSELIQPIVHLPWEQQQGYRDKVCLSAIWEHNKWQFGLTRKGEVVPIADCPVNSDLIRKTIRVLQFHLAGPERFPLAFYIQSGAQVVLVVKAKAIAGFRWPENFFKDIIAAGNDGIWLHLNPTADTKVFAKEDWQFLYGKQRSITKKKLIYGPTSFHQIIPALYNQSVKHVLDFFALKRDDGVIDLYCGAGDTLIEWQRAGAYAIGVEVNGEAVECARMNVSGTIVLRGKCSERFALIDEWIEYRGVKRVFLYTSPPGTGMEPKVISWITGSARPLRIAYLSRSAVTLKRDLDLLTGNGYKVVAVRPFDFFPRTHYMGCLVLLDR